MKNRWRLLFHQWCPGYVEPSLQDLLLFDVKRNETSTFDFKIYLSQGPAGAGPMTQDGLVPGETGESDGKDWTSRKTLATSWHHSRPASQAAFVEKTRRVRAIFLLRFKNKVLILILQLSLQIIGYGSGWPTALERKPEVPPDHRFVVMYCGGVSQRYIWIQP